MVERHKREVIEDSWRVYVTESLWAAPHQKVLDVHWHDVAWPNEADNRSAEDIADGVIERLGMEVEDGPA